MIRTLVTGLLFLVISSEAWSQVKYNGYTGNIEITSGTRMYYFLPEFIVLYSKSDPGFALKPAEIKKVSYNVPTWKVSDSTRADFKQKHIGSETAGDGFDDNILRDSKELRTANLYQAGHNFELRVRNTAVRGDTVFFRFRDNEKFSLQAWLLTSSGHDPVMHMELLPKADGFYSVGYTGAPSFSKDEVAELWQPLIWTEKRSPDVPYMTPAFMSTLPTTLLNDGWSTLGVVASPGYLPFQPLPLLNNSQFGVALFNKSGRLQPQIFAPILGGFKSLMGPGNKFYFSFRLLAEPISLTRTYEKVARDLFGFKDYRHNEIASANTVLDNLVDYSMTDYAWFVDSLKGFAYATDVPDAVKNVSSLNPLELAILRDDRRMFEKRAYPLMEYMLSREKFLFSLDSTQKIQSPSRKLKGPIAPISELAALYNIFGRQNSFYPLLVQKESNSTRVRNLDDSEKGHTWINAMFLFKMTGDTGYLKMSRKMADEYLQERVYKRAEHFGDPLYGSHFFWPTFTNHWIEYLELYELTGEKRYLDAAQDGARHYSLFTWMAPKIPDGLVTVNKGGKAPMYWYLKSKGHKQMYYPEEEVPAWRLSEIGLTPESSGTATGHRAIFMANYAPWMLRVGYLAKDTFLMQVAKAAIVGRYTNFPGYHINTERTTAYEKVDYPLHKHNELSVNSFHYNHILPMASLLVDYLVSDAYVRSRGEIDFPSEYIEGYAYLQSKFYGNAKGRFYDRQNLQLWMPSRLLKMDNSELNYVAARSDDTLYLAFMNQSVKDVASNVTLNSNWVIPSPGATITPLNGKKESNVVIDSTFSVQVAANGITAVAISKVSIKSSFQKDILAITNDPGKDYVEIPEGNAKALLFKLGDVGRRLFVYLEDDDNIWSKAILVYTDKSGKKKMLQKAAYPFEFTVDIGSAKAIEFSLKLIDKRGKIVKSKAYNLGEKLNEHSKKIFK